MHWKNICVVMHEMPHTFGPDYWTHTSEPAPANMQQIYDLRRSLMERGIADGSIRKCNVEATVYMVECFFAGIIHTKMKGFLETPDNVIDEAMMMFRRSIEA